MDTSRTSTRRMLRLLTYWAVVTLCVIVDQSVKAAVRELLAVGERHAFILGLVDLLHVENTGAAFSMGQGAGPVFVCIALGVLVGGMVLAWREELPAGLVACMACVAGGGIGNMIDRLLFGSVTDFLATTFVDFPVFNVADIFVTCGVVVSFVWYARWDVQQERLRKGRGEAVAPAEDEGPKGA